MALLRVQRNYPVEQVEPLPIEIDHSLYRHWDFAAPDKFGLVFDNDVHRPRLNSSVVEALHDRFDLVQPHNLDILGSYLHEQMKLDRGIMLRSLLAAAAASSNFEMTCEAYESVSSNFGWASKGL